MDIVDLLQESRWGMALTPVLLDCSIPDHFEQAHDAERSIENFTGVQSESFPIELSSVQSF
jgi:hypothetical protein